MTSRSHPVPIHLTPTPAFVGSVREQAKSNAKVPVSVVIPCFNEEDMLPLLADTLELARSAMKEEYDVTFIFVDDGSQDRTWPVLEGLFGSRKDCILTRHTRNQGITASILNGIRQAKTEIVCSIDCDCSYDPAELKQIIPLLADDVQMVTASPYHADGNVLAVPAWRLMLSKCASSLYRCVLQQDLATYTSCFRVYRRSAVVDLEISEPGYAGIAEMLGRVDLQGGKIAEYPTTLRVRTTGQSKMKISKTICSQLRVLARLLAIRLFRSAEPLEGDCSRSIRRVPPL